MHGHCVIGSGLMVCMVTVNISILIYCWRKERHTEAKKKRRKQQQQKTIINIVNIFSYPLSKLKEGKKVRPKKKIPVFPLTRPTLYFCADPVIFIAIKNKIKRFSCLPTLSLFHKLKKYCPS